MSPRGFCQLASLVSRHVLRCFYHDRANKENFPFWTRFHNRIFSPSEVHAQATAQFVFSVGWLEHVTQNLVHQSSSDLQIFVPVIFYGLPVCQFGKFWHWQNILASLVTFWECAVNLIWTCSSSAQEKWLTFVLKVPEDHRVNRRHDKIHFPVLYLDLYHHLTCTERDKVFQERIRNVVSKVPFFCSREYWTAQAKPKQTQHKHEDFPANSVFSVWKNFWTTGRCWAQKPIHPLPWLEGGRWHNTGSDTHSRVPTFVQEFFPLTFPDILSIFHTILGIYFLEYYYHSTQWKRILLMKKFSPCMSAEKVHTSSMK